MNGLRWFTFETGYRSDRSAEAMREAGHDAWCPMILTKRAVKRGPRSRTRYVASEAPLFPGYCFALVSGADLVDFDDTWAGIASVMRARVSGAPLPAPERFIRGLMVREVCGIVKLEPRLREALKAGTMMRVIEGLMEGFSVRLAEDCESDAARVWVETFGRETPLRRVSLPMAHMERL